MWRLPISWLFFFLISPLFLYWIDFDLDDSNRLTRWFSLHPSNRFPKDSACRNNVFSKKVYSLELIFFYSILHLSLSLSLSLSLCVCVCLSVCLTVCLSVSESLPFSSSPSPLVYPASFDVSSVIRVCNRIIFIEWIVGPNSSCWFLSKDARDHQCEDCTNWSTDSKWISFSITLISAVGSS